MSNEAGWSEEVLRLSLQWIARSTSAIPAVSSTLLYLTKDGAMDVLRRNNVKVTGDGSRPIVFAHGFGCDYNAWAAIAPDFERDYRVVLFDHVGAGGSDLTAYDSEKYSTFEGYVDDALEVME